MPASAAAKPDLNLAQMVVNAAMRTGHAQGPPAPENRNPNPNMMSMMMGGGPYPTSHQRMSVEGHEHSVSTTGGEPLERKPSHDGFRAPHPPTSYQDHDTKNSIHHHTPASPQSSPLHQIPIPALPPAPAVERLVQVYIDHVQIMLPILHMPTFREMLLRVQDADRANFAVNNNNNNDGNTHHHHLDTTSNATSSEKPKVRPADAFFVLIVLALSTMALSRTLDPTSELRMSSEAFYIEALKYYDSVFEATDSLMGLQAILLLCYYSLFNPTKGSIWFLVGIASRTAIDHGLHHETAQSENLTALERDMNRRLFWSVYNLDRLLSHALGRPPSIPDSFISVPLFSDLPDACITPSGLLPSMSGPDPYKTVSLNFIPLRELQSTIYSRLYSVKSVESPSHEWFMSMFDRLKNWLQNSPEPKGTQSTEGYAVSFHSELLHRDSK